VRRAETHVNEGRSWNREKKNSPKGKGGTYKGRQGQPGRPRELTEARPQSGKHHFEIATRVMGEIEKKKSRAREATDGGSGKTLAAASKLKADPFPIGHRDRGTEGTKGEPGFEARNDCLAVERDA